MSNNSTPAAASVKLFNDYITVGLFAVITNSLIIFILVRNLNFFKRSPFIFGLAIGDLVDGIALVSQGSYRNYLAVNNMANLKVHPSYCLNGFAPVLLMGNQMPGVMFFLIGAERFVAVKYFDWYYTRWSNKIAWTVTTLALVYCMGSLTAACLSATYMWGDSYRIQITCTNEIVFGRVYIAYNYTIGIIGGLAAATATVFAMVNLAKRRNRVNPQMEGSSDIKTYLKQQWNHTRSMLSLALLDLGLVVVPDIMLTLTQGFAAISIVNLSANCYLTICSRSVLNIILYTLINVDFRSAAINAFCVNVFKDLHNNTAHMEMINTTGGNVRDAYPIPSHPIHQNFTKE